MFNPKYADIAAPLNELIKKSKKIISTEIVRKVLRSVNKALDNHQFYKYLITIYYLFYIVTPAIKLVGHVYYKMIIVLLNRGFYSRKFSNSDQCLSVYKKKHFNGL